MPSFVQISFTVSLDFKILSEEFVCVCGSHNLLGNWIPNLAFRLKRLENPVSTDFLSSFTGVVDFESGIDEVNYRYFLASHDRTNAENINIEIWETHVHSRNLDIHGQQKVFRDEKFGLNGNDFSLMRGWLTRHSEVQITLMPHAFAWSSHQFQGRILGLRSHYYTVQLSDESDVIGSASAEADWHPPKITAKSSKYSLTGPLAEQPWPASLVSGDQSGTSCDDPILVFNPQDDVLTFHALTEDYFNLVMDVEVWDSPQNQENCRQPFPSRNESSLFTVESTARPIAYFRLVHFESTSGIRKLHVYSYRNNKPIGIVKVQHLVIRPFPGASQLDMSKCFTSYWCRSHKKSLDVGHRGLGTSPGTVASRIQTLRENTLASLRSASDHGADFVEFDVHLSKDKVPVVFHDWRVLTVLRKKNKGHYQYMSQRVMDLSLQDLRGLKLEDEQPDVHSHNNHQLEEEDVEDAEDNQAFPTLQQCLDSIDQRIGFMIELKYPQAQADGSWECENYFEQNVFVDIILEVIFKTYASPKRPIAFSCFDPDICTMLALKQNVYPVFFLTIGRSVVYSAYRDPRTTSTDMAIKFAKSLGIIGIAASSEELLQDLSLVERTLSSQLILVVWGAKSTTEINLLKESGAHAVIFDKINELYSHGTYSHFIVGPSDFYGLANNSS